MPSKFRKASLNKLSEVPSEKLPREALLNGTL